MSSTTQIALYTFTDKEVRIFGTIDAPWFLAKDVCAILGLTWTHKAISSLAENEKGRTICPTPGGEQEMSIISESGLYRLIFKSQKQEALDFQKWVLEEVLPSLRRNGLYTLEQRVSALESERASLMDEKKELESEVRNRRIVSSSRDFIKVSHRMIQLGFIRYDEFKRLMRALPILGADGREFIAYHPDKGKFLRHFTQICKRLGREWKALHVNSEFAPIRSKDRCNGYTKQDYIDFGDDIIRHYMNMHPYHTWGIDSAWQPV